MKSATKWTLNSFASVTEFRHNTDLNPTDEYLAATAPRVKSVFRHSELLSRFFDYDEKANRAKKHVAWRGRASVAGTAGALTLLCLGLLAVALGAQVREWLIRVTAIAVLAAMYLGLGVGIRRNRDLWLTNRFMTERIRQWHFQSLLDGELIERSLTDWKGFEAERQRRWEQFSERTDVTKGAMGTFLRDENFDLFHRTRAYADATVAADVTRLYADLRIGKQLAYFEYRRDQCEALEKRWEAIGRWALISAALVAVAELIPRVSHDGHAILAAAAMVLLVISAAVRVYAGGAAFAEERERYEGKLNRLTELKGRFEATSAMPEKQMVMEDAERAEIDELRGFLRQTKRASYLM